MKKDSVDQSEFSRAVALADVTIEAREWRLTANTEQCAAIARRLKVESVENFEGAATLWREGRDVLLEGTVNATFGRLCVVSLNPMTEQIDEHFRLRFMKDLPENFEDEPDDEDFELLPDEVIDIGDVLIQQAALAMSAHPRLPDAKPPTSATRDNGELSPFSMLKGLVDESSGTNS